jgi:hypothetical protein
MGVLARGYVWYVNHIFTTDEGMGDGPFRAAEVMKEMTRIQVVFA